MADTDLFVPALRPAARVLIILDDKREEKTASLLPSRGKTAPLARVTDVAVTLGHRVQVASTPVQIDDNIPEVVLFDGAARDVVGQVREFRTDPALDGSIFVVLLPSRVREEHLEALRLAGTDEFLSGDASNLEIQSRIEGAVLLFRARGDISYYRDQLARQTRVDDLTGVMSRRFFFQQAHRECSRARRYGHPLTCLMMEVDHFKMLCSTYGDNLGEQVLRSVATIIGQWTRDSDLVARFADAKFAILLPETGIDGATSAREKIQAALLKHKWAYEGHPIPLTVSIGEAELTASEGFHRTGSEFSSEGDENGEIALSTREALAGLLEDADAALYIARKGARVPDVFVPYTPVVDLQAEVMERPSY